MAIKNKKLVGVYLTPEFVNFFKAFRSSKKGQGGLSQFLDDVLERYYNNNKKGIKKNDRIN